MLSNGKENLSWYLIQSKHGNEFSFTCLSVEFEADGSQQLPHFSELLP